MSIYIYISEDNFVMNVIVVILLISKYQTIGSESIIKYYARVQKKLETNWLLNFAIHDFLSVFPRSVDVNVDVFDVVFSKSSNKIQVLDKIKVQSLKTVYFYRLLLYSIK